MQLFILLNYGVWVWLFLLASILAVDGFCKVKTRQHKTTIPLPGLFVMRWIFEWMCFWCCRRNYKKQTRCCSGWGQVYWWWMGMGARCVSVGMLHEHGLMVCFSQPNRIKSMCKRTLKKFDLLIVRGKRGHQRRTTAPHTHCHFIFTIATLNIIHLVCFFANRYPAWNCSMHYWTTTSIVRNKVPIESSKEEEKRLQTCIRKTGQSNATRFQIRFHILFCSLTLFRSESVLPKLITSFAYAILLLLIQNQDTKLVSIEWKEKRFDDEKRCKRWFVTIQGNNTEHMNWATKTDDEKKQKRNNFFCLSAVNRVTRL